MLQALILPKLPLSLMAILFCSVIHQAMPYETIHDIQETSGVLDYIHSCTLCNSEYFTTVENE